MNKTTLANLWQKRVVLAGLFLGSVLPATAMVHDGVDTIVNFTGKNGAQPQSVIEDSAGDFYGTALNGGKYNLGTVFEVLQDGRMVTLVNFNGSNGSGPEAGLLLAPDGSLYGTTKTGGAHNLGTVFRIAPDGKFSTLYSFNGPDGASPDSGLLVGPDGSIYGATLSGGTDDKGIVFKISSKGKLTPVITFNGTNGANPGSIVRADDGTFYGTCGQGGGLGKGLIYKITPDGHVITLVTFDGKNGSHPVSGLVISPDGILYGTTRDGGLKDLGLVYRLKPDGKYSVLASFNGVNGAHPDSGLVLWSNGYFYMVRLWQNITVKSASVQWAGDNLCGTTSSGGLNNLGTIYRIGDNGDLSTLTSFTGNQGIDLGANPNSIIPGEDGNLYGTTGYGGANSQGTVFRLQLQVWILPVGGSSLGTDAGSFTPPIVSR